MSITDLERRFLRTISLGKLWRPVETFTQRRRPENVSVAADAIARRLTAPGLPAEMRQSEICLPVAHSAPGPAGRACRVRPSSSSLPVPQEAMA
ncbi:MAG TPA: hypothetical protein VNZ61_18295 [Roseomonas sp.]|nr:hypothetical protein [Roseomonas sp.]